MKENEKVLHILQIKGEKIDVVFLLGTHKLPCGESRGKLVVIIRQKILTGAFRSVLLDHTNSIVNSGSKQRRGR